ncbi:hypothetical protein QJS66_17215 [Kocuria rhizophila]|nr:hypothetical protein QJS66_17215 [Kocuria rhizophila]
MAVLVDGALTLYLERGGRRRWRSSRTPRCCTSRRRRWPAGAAQSRRTRSWWRRSTGTALSSEELVTAVRGRAARGRFYQTPKGVRMRAPVGGERVTARGPFPRGTLRRRGTSARLRPVLCGSA